MAQAFIGNQQDVVYGAGLLLGNNIEVKLIPVDESKAILWLKEELDSEMLEEFQANMQNGMGVTLEPRSEGPY